MRMLFTLGLLLATASLFEVHAGGVGLSATRMVYPDSTSQKSLSVRNTDKQAPFLIQSWIEDAGGDHSNAFIITPPLFILKPSSENAIKIIFNGQPLDNDRESLFWLTIKAIPQATNTEGKNLLQFASASRIKLFYRPEALSEAVDDAWKKVSGNLHNGKITLNNPTPYYITTINLKVDGKKVKSVMIPPKSQAELEDVFYGARKFSYQTINDYGAWTKELSYPLKEK